MAIKKIHISNFKSFRELDIELGKFNVLVGANAAGKSNFVQVFRFLNDIANKGLANAISLQGTEYLANMATKKEAKGISVGVAFDASITHAVSSNRVFFGGDATYNFHLAIDAVTGNVAVTDEVLVSSGTVYEWDPNAKEKSLGSPIGESTWTVRRRETRYDIKWDPPIAVDPGEPMWASFAQEVLGGGALLIEHPYMHGARSGLSMAIYDFDPKLPKKAVPVTGKATLEEDGSNLAIVLKDILENSEKKRKFTNLIKDVLPFVEAVRAGKFADKYLLAEIKEKWFSESYLPASFMSDGTIHVGALITALYFGPNATTIIEEPDRNIHPQLIAKVVEMFKEVSKDKQVIVTTHNPEMVKYAGIANLLFVSRDKEGFSTITRPAESKDLKVFLENQMGVEDLFIQNLLGM